jgi:hypothetical protein
LVGWLVGWLVDWLVSWLVGWLVGWLASQFAFFYLEILLLVYGSPLIGDFSSIFRRFVAARNF